MDQQHDNTNNREHLYTNGTDNSSREVEERRRGSNSLPKKKKKNSTELSHKREFREQKICHFVWFAAQNFVTSMDSHWNGSNVTIIYAFPNPAGIPHSVRWIQNSWPPLSSQRVAVRSLYCHTIKWVYPLNPWIKYS